MISQASLQAALTSSGFLVRFFSRTCITIDMGWMETCLSSYSFNVFFKLSESFINWVYTDLALLQESIKDIRLGHNSLEEIHKGDELLILQPL